MYKCGSQMNIKDKQVDIRQLFHAINSTLADEMLARFAGCMKFITLIIIFWIGLLLAYNLLYELQECVVKASSRTVLSLDLISISIQDV
ncbi:hypothetical protein SK128_001542 [Halocaridina rubra]|uniref:Uncharacterized protein n=1 Tax=Halocaridina rubra TaxID=373956 RepID=A0AAN8X8E6_HALRR